jgi:SAM-dependent methyltransferase
LADRVGANGSVTAIDQDTGLLADLASRPNIKVVEADLTTMTFPESSYDLVHSRSVLMHLHDPDTVVARVAAALRPGGWVLFEEVDGAPAQRAASEGGLPEPFLRVMVPLALSWTWARHLADRLTSLGLVDVDDDIRADLLVGGTPAAAFWRQTLEKIRSLVTDGAGMRAMGQEALDDGSYDAILDLLDDPGFEVPFAARHRVSARRP